MTPSKRFFFGGAGALLPVIASIVTLDVETYLAIEYSWPQIIGVILRYTLLFLLGGFVTYLHDNENKPFKLVELGVGAPALITSLVAGHAISNSPSEAAHGNNISASSFFIIRRCLRRTE